MIRDITIGQYYAVDSMVHRMDPRTKLAGTMLYIVSLFVAKGIVGYVLAGIFLALAIHTSKIPFGYLVRGLKAIMILLLISVSFNLFLTSGDVIFSIPIFVWHLTLTWQGLERAVFMAIRLVMLIMGSSMMTLTTTPNQLTDGLEKSLGFLKRVKVPVHEISMMMSIALRFIPILIEETDKIMKAQMARGADFESGNLIQKAKSMVPLLVPLFISAFRRATDLAMAMEARCYHGGGGRTKMKPLKYTKVDAIGYGYVFGYLAVMIVWRIVN
ncbi:MAG: energy-coupling factor transporter transmembrane component T family protein [Lachnospiraceae bacterium]